MARLLVNGTVHEVECPPEEMLLETLRDRLGLTGTKYACGEGACGACTVLVDGSPVHACTVAADEVAGAEVRTIEGVARDGRLHPVQQAFVDERALQCGYCTAGMVTRAVALLEAQPDPDEHTVVAQMAGNVCRCGGYPAIVRAVLAAARRGGDDTDALEEPQPAAREAPGGSLWTAVLPPRDGSGGWQRGWGWSTPGGARLTLDETGRVRAQVGKVDGGQGNRVALTRLVAAELGTPTTDVVLEMGDTARSPEDLGTFGSRSTPDAGHALRLAAVALRQGLVAEAADRWAVPAERLIVGNGAVCDGATGRMVRYGALVAAGPRTLEGDWEDALPPVPPGLARLDDGALRAVLRGAVTGAKRFPSDVTAPDLLHARVLRPPARGARLLALDTGRARALPGATVVELDGLVAALGGSRAVATRGLRALDARWSDGEGPDEAGLEGYLRARPVDRGGWQGVVEHAVGDVDRACEDADVLLETSYTTAFLAHVPLEPRVAVARAHGDGVTVWVGTQTPFAVRGEVASALGVEEERVRVVVPDFGGGFGGKHAGDVAVEAARLARATGRPVKVAWSRGEEFRHGYFRPAAVIDVRCGAERDGTLTAWEQVNLNSGAAALASPYVVANQRVRYQPADSPLRQGSYRALAATANNFARESHMDEVALVLGVDPVALRLRHLEDERLRAALTAVAEVVDRPVPAGAGASGTGIACGLEKDARVATAAEVRVAASGRLEVRRIVTAVDCGAVVDPTGLRNQVVGATIMGLGGALFESVGFAAGRVLSDRLSRYRVPRFTDVPPIEVIILDRPDVPSAGAGETPIIAVAPALANAIRAATGRRLRALPLAPAGVVPRD